MNSPAGKPAAYTGHFFSLDVLRGLASLGVVLCHWQHFFYNGTKLGPFDVQRQPFFVLLRPLYTEGFQAVDLFFCLSGFIFFWLYAERVADRRTSGKEFTVLRFSRLYPLHFLTLLFVAVAQMIRLKWFGSFFVYPKNDLYHFVLQLFFVSDWGFQKGASYNGPIWSVSIEILLYAIFFAVCLMRFNRWWQVILLVVASAFLPLIGRLDLSRGMFAFFMGSLAYLTFLHLWRRGVSRSQLLGLIAFTTVLWIVLPLNFGYNALYETYRASPWWERLLVHHKDVVGVGLISLTQNSLDALLFPVTLLMLALVEASRGTLGRRVAFLGNISYSTYLIHFPLQLVFMMTVMGLGLPNTIFYSPWMLLGFFGVLIPLSLGSYHFIERPAQKFLRAKLLGVPRERPAYAACAANQAAP